MDHNTLYIVIKADEKTKRKRYIGYVIVNMAAVKVMEAQCIEDVDAYMERQGYKHRVIRIPKEQKYQMIRVKEW